MLKRFLNVLHREYETSRKNFPVNEKDLLIYTEQGRPHLFSRDCKMSKLAYNGGLLFGYGSHFISDENWWLNHVHTTFSKCYPICLIKSHYKHVKVVVQQDIFFI